MDEAIKIIEQRLERAQNNADRYHKAGDMDLFQWYAARALELEYTLNELAGAYGEDA